jgi:hypothetical protein
VRLRLTAFGSAMRNRSEANQPSQALEQLKEMETLPGLVIFDRKFLTQKNHIRNRSSTL